MILALVIYWPQIPSFTFFLCSKAFF